MYDTLAVERKAPSTAKSFETLPALAHGIPAGPIDKYNNICDGIHLGVTPPPGDDTPDSPVLPALIIPEQPSEPDFTHGIAVSDLASPFEAPDPGIGVALSTDDDGWRWEEDIDFCYENAGEPDINLNWWRKSLDPVQCFDFGQKLQQPADRDRDTDLASPVSLTDDDTTMPSTAPTSVVSSICGPRHLTPNTTNESTHAQDEAVSHDALKYTKESSGLGIVGQPVTEENVTLSRTSSTARKHRSSLSTFDSLPELVRSQSHIPPAEDALANNVKQAGKAPKSEKPLPLRSKEESVCKREKILSVQPSPPPPISLPPVPDSARSSQRKLASAHDYSRSEINLASLAQKAAQATPASAASPFKHGKNASIAQLETSSRRRAASIGRPGSQSRPQAKRRMSYSIFPTRDTVPTCAIPGKPLAPIPAGRPPVAQSVVRS
ncbi:hypothetical protein KEM55_007780 [Ascosphaera atra]|nr:hypothetical protein KEM55_007780 [Ascosphaera atra]